VRRASVDAGDRRGQRHADRPDWIAPNGRAGTGEPEERLEPYELWDVLAPIGDL
jgi:hypothetical protein